MQQLEPTLPWSAPTQLSQLERKQQKQRVAPLFYEMQQLEPLPRCGQLRRGHLSSNKGRTVATWCAIVP
eukprot:11070084-Karenia_brevis.AAC.1